MRIKDRFIVMALIVCAASGAWIARGFKESTWRMKQSLHIRWNITNFSDQYNRLHKLGDEGLLHSYITNFSYNACTLLNYDVKYAPNTFNLVERYYYDWNDRIDKMEEEGRSDKIMERRN